MSGVKATVRDLIIVLSSFEQDDMVLLGTAIPGVGASLSVLHKDGTVPLVIEKGPEMGSYSVPRRRPGGD